MDGGARVAAVDEVPADSSFLFTVREVDGDGEREAILVRVEDGDGERIHGVDGTDGAGSERPGTGDWTDERIEGDAATGERTDGNGDGDGAAHGVAAWFNYCQHFTHIRLDKGSGAEFRDGEVVCTNHGAMFDAGTGLCTFGPCEGAYLEPVGIDVRDGVVYLTDGDYEFVAAGPMEKDPLDLSSKSNVEF